MLSQSYWRQQKQRIIYQLKMMIEDVDYSKEIEKIDTIVRNSMRIKNFYGHDNDEIKYDKNFETNCIILSKYTNEPIKNLTTKEYFALLKYVDDQSKKK